MSNTPERPAWRCATCKWADGDPERRTVIAIVCTRQYAHRKLAMTTDGTSIWVAPDFGCVQWEAKDV